MKKIMAIILVSLLGFLGCSGSDGGTLAVGEANSVAPFGIVETPIPTYEWTPVRLATRYRLVVQDTNEASTTADTNENAIIDEWYTAEEAGCASEEGLCKVTPDAEVIGKNEFQVQACANDECGLWGESLTFNVTAMNGPRFTDNGDSTVTDNKTQLVWWKNANYGGLTKWHAAMIRCDGLVLAGLSDWRLPEIHELRSVIDEDNSNPALPPGNPFSLNAIRPIWSSTTCKTDASGAWCVHMDYGRVYGADKMLRYYVWPVRSGN